jgi:ABC-type lipoprotein export system ATPase subunit
MVSVFGTQIGRLAPRRLADYRARTLGYLDQHYVRALAPELSARTLVAVQLGLRGAPASARLARADELLERVGLADKRERRPGELSGGEQQRVALCAALAHRPRVFLADEPTGELDAVNAELVYGLIAQLVREHGCTAVMVSHDPESANVADRIVRIRDGRLAEEWSREEGGGESIVVGRGGWLRLPEELLRRAGIGERATARLEERSVVVAPVADGASQERPDAPSAPGPPRQAPRTVASARGLAKSYAATTQPSSSSTPTSAPAVCRRSPGRRGRERRRSCTCSPGSSFPTGARLSSRGSS